MYVFNEIFSILSMIECFTWLDFQTHWIFSHFRIQSDFFILLQMPSEINDFINELRSTYANVRLIPQNRPNSESDANKLNGTLIRRKGIISPHQHCTTFAFTYEIIWVRRLWNGRQKVFSDMPSCPSEHGDTIINFPEKRPTENIRELFRDLEGCFDMSFEFHFSNRGIS